MTPPSEDTSATAPRSRRQPRVVSLIIGFLLGVTATLAAEGVYIWIQVHRVTSEKARRPVTCELPDSSNLYQRWVNLSEAAMACLEKGRLDEAAARARELLLRAESHREDWNYGNAVHKGNMVLGRVALRRGDINAAKYHLMASGRTPGSPQLDSFGPNMTLAKELLEGGERDAVVAYLNDCSHFWKMDRGKLKQWAALAEKGLVPDFGPNLSY